MIKPGIKVGPTDWLSKFERTQAKYCEIWYRIDKPEWYTKQFSYIADHQIQAGLHYWGTVGKGYETNISYPGEIQEASINQIKLSLDVAAKQNMHYLNVHCGSSLPVKINLDTQEMTPDETQIKISLQKAAKTQRQSLIELDAYAKKVGILFLVETVPAKLAAPRSSWGDKSGRLHPVNQYTVPSQYLLERAKSDDIHITNDLCHTFAGEYDKPLEDLWESLWGKTIAMAPYTNLLHINTTVPPYNGTESHHGITNQDFLLPGIFPTKEKLIQLLSIFSDRDDVWAINEPSHNHVENYFALKSLLNHL